MKVTFISTQYVETDACSFKNVVQELTGKDAIVAAGPFDSLADSEGGCYGGGGGKINEDKGQFDGGGRGGGTMEFDRFFKELFPMEELSKIWLES
ncbi:unnamed protein product [Cochlearia groenlandica]